MKTIVYFIFLLLGQMAFSQGNLTGIVTDSDSKPVFAANVFLQSNPQTGSTTDFDGNFTIRIDNNALKDTLIVSFIGYKTSRLPLSSFEEGQQVKIILEDDNTTLGEVSIVAKEPISEQFSVTKLEALDIYLNPISNGDPLKAITGLPASTTTDESANPSLRGSSADRTKVVVNEVPVYNPVRSSQIDGVGHFSLFNTEIIHKQYVYASNPPLTYGNTSAGLVEIETIDNLKENFFSLSAGLAHAGIFLSQKTGQKSFIQAYTNFQISDAFIEINKKALPELKNFSSKDAGINFHSSLAKNLSFNLFSYGIIEDYKVNFNLFTANSDAIGENKRNFNIINLKYQFKKGFLSFGNGTNFSETLYSYGNIYSVNNQKQHYNSLNYKYIINDRINFQLGACYDYSYNKYRDSIPVYYFALSSGSDNYYNENRIENQLLETYGYLSYNISDNILIMAGLRKNIPIENRDSYLSTQLGLKYKFSDKQNILLSGGIYHNYSIPNYYMESFELFESEQIALDYSLEVNNLNLSAALFYKDEKGEKVSSDYITYNGTITTGAELFLDYYFSKSLKITFANTFLNQKIKLEGNEFRGEKDLNYFIKATLNYSNPGLFTAAVTYVGRPGMFYTPIIYSEYNDDAGFYQPFFSHDINSAQYTSYNNISINFSKYIQFYDHVYVLYASCNNLLNCRNQSNPVYNQDYSSKEYRCYQLRMFYFGVVWQMNY